MHVLSLSSDGPVTTRAIGRALGEALSGGDFLALTGELGAGKTTFVQGVAEGLGVAERYITSPSFALVNEYDGRVRLYHIDLYRLSGPESLADIGFEEFPGEGVAAVEWPERAGRELPDERLDIVIRVTGGDAREITISPSGARYEELTARICLTSR